MKKVRFLVDLYDIKNKTFYSYNDVAECDAKVVDEWYKKGYVDILKEKPTKKKTVKKTTKKAKPVKKATKKEGKKDTNKK